MSASTGYHHHERWLCSQPSERLAADFRSHVTLNLLCSNDFGPFAMGTTVLSGVPGQGCFSEVVFARCKVKGIGNRNAGDERLGSRGFFLAVP